MLFLPDTRKVRLITYPYMTESKAIGYLRWLVSLVLFFTFTVNQLLAQQNAGITFQNLNQVKVDQLTDDQISTFWKQAKASGYTKVKLEAMARERKMPETELQKLLVRIDKLEEKVQQPQPTNGKVDASTSVTDIKQPINGQIDKTQDKSLPKVFGADVFTNPKITFEPSLNIPTPANYILGPGDELALDIYGYSEASYQLKVTPDGSVRIPGAGLIKVSGASIDQARTRITNVLQNVYSTIATGQTRINISITNIRSIKVTVVGEAFSPGTYTLPSLATVFNVLHACGGPSQNGSLRTITVIRSGKSVATVDVYEFLVKGNSRSNIQLQDQDIVKINPYEARVELRGHVKTPALFDVKAKETLKDVIEFAGGFTTAAYTEKIKVQRNTPTQKSIADIDAQVFGMFTPANGDIYMVDQLLNRFENRVTLEGAVFRPGEFGLTPGMTLRKLITMANGLKEDAFTSRVIIYRLKEDNTLGVISVDLSAVMNGSAADVTLKREDRIVIASKLDMREALKVRIEGEVIMPGTYDYAANMKLEDIIIAAGGLKESASLKQIVVGRRTSNADRTSAVTDVATVFTLSVQSDLKENPQAASFELLPYDIVTVFANPGYLPQQTVKVYGQVMYPGEFVIAKNKERLSEVLKRAGGITNDGFAEGAILIRQRVSSPNQTMITQNKNRALKKLAEDDTYKDLVKQDEFGRNFDLFAIDLKKILSKPGGKEDIYVFDKDIINVPRVLQSVMVSGEVLFPVKIVYDKSKSFSDYINESGGFTSSAHKRKAFVVYANGSAKSTKNLLFLRFRPKLKPGAEIIVPPKERREKLSNAETISVITSTTTLLLIITTTFFTIFKP